MCHLPLGTPKRMSSLLFVIGPPRLDTLFRESLAMLHMNMMPKLFKSNIRSGTVYAIIYFQE